MKSIQPVHTLRLSVQPRELTIGQAQLLCAIPYQFAQRTITEFLRAVCTEIPRASGHPCVMDPLQWSVNERMHVTIYYLAAILDEGDGPDFLLGKGHLHDYLLSGADYVEAVTFTHGNEAMLCTPLHGYQAEAIETLVETGALPKTYFSWHLGVMAACIRGVDEPPIEYSDPASYGKALLDRINELKGVPESDFLELYDLYANASLSLQHFVHAVFNHEGVVAAQVTEPNAETGVPELGLARFHPRTGISQRTCDLLDAAA